jgi:hypothetical protein
MIYILANIAYSLALMAVVILNIIGIQESGSVLEFIFRAVVIFVVIGVAIR